MMYRFLSLSFLMASLLITASEQRQLQSPEPASGWNAYTADTTPSRRDWTDSFMQDCVTFATQNSAIPSHEINDETIRIASYNIHFWCNPEIEPIHYETGTNRHHPQDIERNFDNVMSVLKNINADILCLQELLMFDTERIEKHLKELGYEHIHYVHEADWAGDSLCVAIASKYPFCEDPKGKTFEVDTQPNSHPYEKHCYAKAAFSFAGRKIPVYTSHFDCFDNTENIRYHEVKELIEDANNAPKDNTLICGDFNAVRKQDLEYAINGTTAWKLLNKDTLSRTQMPTQTKALEQFNVHGFKDCFDAGNIAMPKFSVWNGTVVDFMFLNKKWSLPIKGAYFYYTSISDHLPVILDIAI